MRAVPRDSARSPAGRGSEAGRRTNARSCPCPETTGEARPRRPRRTRAKMGRAVPDRAGYVLEDGARRAGMGRMGRPADGRGAGRRERHGQAQTGSEEAQGAGAGPAGAPRLPTGGSRGLRARRAWAASVQALYCSCPPNRSGSGSCLLQSRR